MPRIDLTAFKARLRPMIPPDWTARLGAGKFGLGHDVATTEAKKSNPSALAVCARKGTTYHFPLIWWWKTVTRRFSRSISMPWRASL